MYNRTSVTRTQVSGFESIGPVDYAIIILTLIFIPVNNFKCEISESPISPRNPDL